MAMLKTLLIWRGIGLAVLFTGVGLLFGYNAFVFMQRLAATKREAQAFCAEIRPATAIGPALARAQTRHIPAEQIVRSRTDHARSCPHPYPAQTKVAIDTNHQEYDMRTTILLCSMVLATMPALAQNSGDQPGTASPQEQQGNAMQGSESMHTMQDAATKAQDMPGKGGMSARHEEMTLQVRTDMAALRAQLQKMRDQTARISDQSRQQDMQLNNDMWQSLIDHMDRHMTKMAEMMDSTHSGQAAGDDDARGKGHYSQ